MTPLAAIAHRVNARCFQAAVNPEVAKTLADLLKSHLGEMIPKIDFHYDALKSGLRGMSEAAMSFPARPVEFNEEDLNGTILVRGTLSPPIQGSGKALAQKNTKLTLNVGFYFKTPRLPGEGKYMLEQPAGVLDIEFNEEGVPVIKNEEEIVALVDAYKSLTAKVLSDVPEGAKRLTPKDPHEQKVQREQNEEAEKFTRETEREKKQHQEIKEQQDANATTHGTPEAFAQYMADQEETSFGPGDLQKVLDTVYGDKNSRLMMRNVMIEKLKELGLKWDPSKRTVATSKPTSLASALREVALYLETSDQVSRSRVAARLEFLLRSI